MLKKLNISFPILCVKGLCNNYIYFGTNYLLYTNLNFSMNTLLEVNKVVKQYGDYVALNEVSLTVPKGSMDFRSKWCWKTSLIES
jgi:hypothetical protein